MHLIKRGKVIPTLMNNLTYFEFMSASKAIYAVIVNQTPCSIKIKKCRYLIYICDVKFSYPYEQFKMKKTSYECCKLTPFIYIKMEAR